MRRSVRARWGEFEDRLSSRQPRPAKVDAIEAVYLRQSTSWLRGISRLDWQV